MPTTQKLVLCPCSIHYFAWLDRVVKKDFMKNYSAAKEYAKKHPEAVVVYQPRK